MTRATGAWSLRLRAVVAASRAGQGLPPTIEDPVILERIAALMRGSARADDGPSRPL